MATTIEVLNTGEYQGSEKNRLLVLKQITDRWGKKEAKNYDPYKNCLTYLSWQKKGYIVKKGEKALKSITYIKKKEIDDETGKEIKTYSYPKIINLFYKKQVKKVK